MGIPKEQKSLDEWGMASSWRDSLAPFTAHASCDQGHPSARMERDQPLAFLAEVILSTCFNKSCELCLSYGSYVGVGRNLLLSILMGWTSICQLFWGSLGARVLTNSHVEVGYKMHQDARSIVNPRNPWFPRHFPPHRGKAQIAALRHVVSSAELLCREDKTILMWPALKKPHGWCWNFGENLWNKHEKNRMDNPFLFEIAIFGGYTSVFRQNHMFSL